ncbi:MAG TPA: dihydrolipoamide acetyltransferase family protein [Anaerolineae bacterium]|nr:dihydrolipoamide acetyltransferase family protein [Anaerolineae bacterium]
MSEYRMPSLGADMEAGVLVEWKVHPGDHIHRGDIIADVETDKGIIEVEVFEDGVIDKILIEPNTKVPVGTVLAMISPAGAAAPVSLPPAPAAQEVAQAVAAAPPPAKRARVSPLARKLAAELGVALDTIAGTGPNGAIERGDVEQAVARLKAAAKAEAPPRVEIQPGPPPALAPDFQAGMRRAIAAAMARANREIPHYYLESRIDMSRPLRWLEEENLKRSMKDRILPAVLLMKAVAKALTDVPELNAYWLDDRPQVQEAIHIGFAIALRQGGLVTPALHHADLKSLDELMADLRDLITRTRAGRLRSSELSEATITVTSLGDMGVEKVFGVIYPPQVALVGFGKVSEQPWVEHGMLGLRPVLIATLAGDHRATDGLKGAQFLEALNKHLQEADKL